MELSSAYKAQDNIGWDNMMQGWIYHHWNQFQSYCLKEGKSRKTGLNWASSFIEKLLKLFITSVCIGMYW